MTFWNSVLAVAGTVILIFILVEYKKEEDIVKVFEKVFKPKYFVPWLLVIIAFIFFRLILMLLAPLLRIIFSP